MQTSFLENLIRDDKSSNQFAEIRFPKNFKINNFNKLRDDLNDLARNHGLTMPTKLKKGQLVLEIKPSNSNEKNEFFKNRKTSLTFEEIKAIEESFD